MQQIDHPKFLMSLLQKNCISLEIKEGEQIDSDDIHAIYTGYDKLIQNEDYVVAVYANPFSSMTKAAREVAATSYYSDRRKKVAFISDNLGHIILIKFFQKINSSKTNLRIFRNEDDAFNWLLDSAE